MTPKQRKKLLKKFNGTNQAEAILEVLEEVQNSLLEESIEDSEDMADVKGKRYAIDALDRFKRKINVQEESNDNTSYEWETILSNKGVDKTTIENVKVEQGKF